MSTSLEAAAAFQEAILAGRALEAWRTLTKTHRFELATDWVDEASTELQINRGEVVGRLASDHCGEAWWLEHVLATFRARLPADPTGWGWATNRRDSLTPGSAHLRSPALARCRALREDRGKVGAMHQSRLTRQFGGYAGSRSRSKSARLTTVAPVPGNSTRSSSFPPIAST